MTAANVADGMPKRPIAQLSKIHFEKLQVIGVTSNRMPKSFRRARMR